MYRRSLGKKKMFSNKKLCSMLFCLLAVVIRPASADDTDATIQLLTQNFPPYTMAADGKNFAREAEISGIDTEVVQEMFKRAKITYALSLRFPWSRLQEMAEQQSGFGVFSLSRTTERESKFKWVGPLSGMDLVLLKKQGSAIKVTDLDKAKSFSIASKKGSVASEYLIKRGFTVQDSLSDNPKKLRDGKMDLWATSNPSGIYEAHKAGVDKPDVALTFEHAELYLALNKTTPDDVVAKLQSALDSMKKDGFLEQVKAKYLDK